MFTITDNLFQASLKSLKLYRNFLLSTGKVCSQPKYCMYGMLFVWDEDNTL